MSPSTYLQNPSRCRLPWQFRVLALALTLAAGNAFAASNDELDRLVTQRESEHGFSGKVLVERGDEIVFERSYGLADFELGVPFDEHSELRIGSITKPFTAAAVLLLERAGKLSLSDPVCRFLDPCPEEWKPIQIRHLLTHTSGVPDLFEKVAEAPVEATVAQMYETITSTDDLILTSEPGERYAYNNFGYLLLGAVIEAASGQHYEDFLRQSIWRPLGLDHTRYDRVWEIIEGRARGYTVDGARRLNTEYDDPCAFSAGGLLSTPRDLARFVRAVVSGDLLGEEATRRTLTPYRDDYGFGWVVAEHFGHPVVWHDGGIGGFSSQLAHYPDDDLTVVVLSNVENANPRGIACSAAALFLGEEPPLGAAREAVTLPADRLAVYSGTYETEAGDTRSVTLEDGHLAYRGRIPLVPVGDGTFFFQRPDHYKVIFETAADGSATGFAVEECGAVILRARKVDTPED